MTSVVLAAVSALVWGTADYCGGRATQRENALVVTVASQMFGLPVLALCVLLVPGHVLAADLAWGAGAGVAGLLGIVFLYQSLSTGAMAVAAPITAVSAALVPMGIGLATDRWPSALAFGGAACAVVAIALVSIDTSGGGRATPRVVGLALTAGALFGLFFALLAQTHDYSGMWPLAAVRCVSIPVGLLAIAYLRVSRRFRAVLSLRPAGALVGWVAVAGLGDIAANALFLLAAREGLLSVVAPIAALYPVSTVLLALTVDGERVRPVQVFGLGLAAAALVLAAV